MASRGLIIQQIHFAMSVENLSRQKWKSTGKVGEAYKAYFGMPGRDQDKLWSPHFIKSTQVYFILMQGCTEGKREPWSSLSQEFGRNPVTTQATAILVWWTFLNVGMTRMQLLSSMKTFLHPSAYCHTALLPVPTPLDREQQSSEVSSKPESEDNIVDPDYNFRGGVRREIHTTSTNKTSMTWSEIIWCLGSSNEIWMKVCKSRVSPIKLVTKFFPSSLPVKVGFASATMWPVCSRQSELAAGSLLKPISLMLILMNSKRTWEHTQRSKVSVSTRIYWTLNAATMDNLMRTWWKTVFGGCFVKVIYNIFVNLEKLLTSKSVVVILV